MESFVVNGRLDRVAEAVAEAVVEVVAVDEQYLVIGVWVYWSWKEVVGCSMNGNLEQEHST